MAVNRVLNTGRGQVPMKNRNYARTIYSAVYEGSAKKEEGGTDCGDRNVKAGSRKTQSEEGENQNTGGFGRVQQKKLGACTKGRKKKLVKNLGGILKGRSLPTIIMLSCKKEGRSDAFKEQVLEAGERSKNRHGKRKKVKSPVIQNNGGGPFQKRKKNHTQTKTQ